MQSAYITVYSYYSGQWVHVRSSSTVNVDDPSQPPAELVDYNVGEGFASGEKTIVIQGSGFQFLNDSAEYGSSLFEFMVGEAQNVANQTHTTEIYTEPSIGTQIIISPAIAGDYYRGPFPPEISTGSSSSAVCFLEGTYITTDQGPIPIEQLTNNNTIFASKVNNITESINYFGHLIHFKPNSLAQDLPSTDTFVSPTHAIFCPKDKCMKMAKDFCDGENVLEDFTKDKNFKIYNVVCEDDKGDIIPHSMYVNNLLCECLHPHAYPLVKNQLKF